MHKYCFVFPSPPPDSATPPTPGTQVLLDAEKEANYQTQAARQCTYPTILWYLTKLTQKYNLLNN